VIVQAPKVLDHIEASDLVLHVLPGLGAIVLQIPERPGVLQGMFQAHIDEPLEGLTQIHLRKRFQILAGTRTGIGQRLGAAVHHLEFGLLGRQHFRGYFR